MMPASLFAEGCVHSMGPSIPSNAAHKDFVAHPPRWAGRKSYWPLPSLTGPSRHVQSGPQPEVRRGAVKPKFLESAEILRVRRRCDRATAVAGASPIRMNARLDSLAAIPIPRRGQRRPTSGPCPCEPPSCERTEAPEQSARFKGYEGLSSHISSLDRVLAATPTRRGQPAPHPFTSPPRSWLGS